MPHQKRKDGDHHHKKPLPPSAASWPDRTILLHYHIFKNGGSTLDAALKKNLGAAWREIEGDDPDGPMNWPLALAVLKNHPEIKALSSHTARLPAPARQGYNFIPLLLIRHPLDRILSIYWHERRSPFNNANPALGIARSGTLSDFIRIALEKTPAVVCDAQTSALARGGMYYSPPVAADLTKAKAVVMQSLAPGVVERMDEHLVLLEGELAHLLPKVDLACPDENRNPTRRPSLLARLREIRSSLPPPLWQELRKRNRLDLELWRFTYRLARTRFSKMPDATKRLDSFRQRKAQSLPPAELPWTGERLVAAARGDLVAEHLHRYALAVEFASERDVLDVACGEGYGSSFLARVARSVTGVDCDAPTIAHASAKYRAKNLRFAEGPAEKLPLPASSVDLVVSFETLEHLENHDAMLQEIKRVLRPGGRLLISTPDSQPYRTASGKLNPFHLRELDRSDFTKLLSKYFKQVTVGYQRSVTGSWITPLDHRPAGSTEYSGDFQLIAKVESGADAPYLIALASDLPVPALPSSLFNGTQELLAQVQALTKEREHERKSFAALTAEFAERTAWAQSLEKELRTAQGNLEKLNQEHADRTTWAQSLEADLKKSHAAIAAQTKLAEERTAWAQALEKELSTTQSHLRQLTQEFAERSTWALSLEAELKQSHTSVTTQTKLAEERTAWAQSLEMELSTTQGHLRQLTQEFAERSTWALSLDAELKKARAAYHEREQAAAEISLDRDRLSAEITELAQRNANLELDLTAIRNACAALAPLIPFDTGKGELALLEQCLATLANLHRAIATKNSEVHAATASTLGAQLRAEVAESDALRLTAALKDAQLHLDGLLLCTARLQQQSDTLAVAKQGIEHQLSSIVAELQATRQELARYESRLICRLAARAPGAKSPDPFRP